MTTFSLLEFFVFTGDAKNTEEIIRENPHFKKFEPFGSPSLVWTATRSGNVNLVKILIKYGFKFKKGYSDLDTTPLFEAVLKEDYEITKLLLENGAPVDIGVNKFITLQNGERLLTKITPLMQACANGFIQIMKLLVKYGADPFSNGLKSASMNLMFKNPFTIQLEKFYPDNNLEIEGSNFFNKSLEISAKKTIEMLNFFCLPWSPRRHFFSSPKDRKKIEMLLHCIKRTSYFKLRSKRKRPDITKVVLSKELWFFIISLIPKEFSLL
jgi:hypothetical protein